MRLSEEERTTLNGIASSLVSPGSVSAVCAYGSKVAGYARPDSDYDLIVVSKRFRGGIRYKYLNAPLPSSALVVDEELLREDAQSAYLGEFVVGRFLNIYEPLLNGGFLRAVELQYKRRVIIEALLSLSSDYGDFGRHLVVPYEYFLFDKLSKRAEVYPPALYSYVQTYSGAHGAENKAATSEGFRAAAENLVSRGFLSAGNTGVQYFPEKLRGDAFTKVQSIFDLTTRGVTQYAVHGYAGRVGLSVFGKEAQSKLRRMRENPTPLPQLTRPRSLLKLEEGVVIPDSSLLVKEIAHLLGFDIYSTKERDIGEPYSTTRVLTFRNSDRESSVIVKNYAHVRSLKWALLGVWASAANKFSTGPLARLDREYGMTLRLRAEGILVPGILAVAPGERIMVKQFVGGRTLAGVIDGLLRNGGDGLQSVSAYGEVVARVHLADLALGDTKASNVIVAGEDLYLTDLEQALPSGDKAWDVAEFLFYTAKLSTREGPMRVVAKAFLDSYAKGPNKENVGKARGQKYFRPFSPFITKGMGKMLKDLMAEY